MNAMYEPTSASAEWDGARLAWTGLDWALRFVDGRLARFHACGFGIQGRRTLTSYRNADGHVIRYRHNRAGRLERIEAGRNRWIALDYDEQDRVVRAYASTNRDERYEYDGRGRLAKVTSDGAVTHTYTYTDLDEMARIIEPDADIENSYEGGRCVKQVNRFKDGSPPYTLTWDYAPPTSSKSTAPRYAGRLTSNPVRTEFKRRTRASPPSPATAIDSRSTAPPRERCARGT